MDASMVMAYFRGGYSLGDFLFKGFEIETPGAFAGVFIGLVSLAILFEGLRIVRDFLMNRFTDTRKQALAFSLRANQGSVRYSRTIRDPGGSQFNEQEVHSLKAGDSSGHDDLEDDENGQENLVPIPGTSSSSALQRDSTDSSSERKKVRYEDLIFSTLIHMIYINIGYILMLAVMTFNVWILVAVSIGILIGYFIFGTWRRSDYLALDSRTLITTVKNYREGSSEKTVSTNSDSGNSLQDGKSRCKGVGPHGDGSHVVADADVHHTTTPFDS